MPIEEHALYDATTHRLIATVPAGGQWRALPLDSVDISRLPGSEVVALARIDASGFVAYMGCARGASGRFAPGLEGVLFDRAMGLAFKTMALAPASTHIVREGSDATRFEQVVEGEPGEPLRVHQIITFAGEDRDLLLCSVVCSGVGCGESHLTVQGSPPNAPPPNVVLRGVFFAAEHPAAVLGGLTVLAALLIGLLLWKRPFPRPG